MMIVGLLTVKLWLFLFSFHSALAEDPPHPAMLQFHTLLGQEISLYPNQLFNAFGLVQSAEALCQTFEYPPTATIGNRSVQCSLCVAYEIMKNCFESADVVNRLGSESLQATMAQLNHFIYHDPQPLSSSRSCLSLSSSASKDGKECSEEMMTIPITQRLIKHVNRSFRRANLYQSKLSVEALLIEGFSGTKTRHFYNNLADIVIDPSRKTEYLEVGTFEGSSLVATLSHNSDVCHATIVENWAEFGGPRTNFFNVLQRFHIANESVNIFEEDFFSWNVSRLSHTVDIYLYDGAHDYDSHYHAITHIWSQLSPVAIVVVDDWNLQQVRQGTFDGLAAVHAVIEEQWEITYTVDSTHTPKIFAGSEYWNGIAVFVVNTSGTA